VGRWAGLAPAVGMTAAATAAAVHLPVAVEHVAEVRYLGVAGYAFVILSAGLLGSLLVEQTRGGWALLAVLNGAAVIAYVVSRVVGLPAAQGAKGDWFSVPGLVSVAAELVVVVMALATVRRLRAGSRDPAATATNRAAARRRTRRATSP
jgi:hypothetical protein